MLLNIYLYFFKYSRVPVNIKKLCGYSHNGYSTDMSTGTRQIFIQRVGYGGPTILPYPPVDIPSCRHVWFHLFRLI